jgi:drug/metabolite transporter (DMT)-like permease
VPPLALALVAVAAVLHAGWNILLKTSGDTLRTAVRLQAVGTAILVPIAIVAWLANGRPPIATEGIVIAVGSGLLEAAYFVFLSAAYRRGDLSLVYPIARGSAPLLAVLVGVAVLGERLGGAAALGVACLLVGILVVARPWRALRASGREHRGAIGFALATGVTIAAYSAVDRVGVRIIEPWQYGAILAVAATAFLAVIATVGRRLGLIWSPSVPAELDAPRPPPGSLARDGLTGVLSLTAYLLILVAYSMAPLAAVAPLRESAIVLAAAWGSIRLGEAGGRREAALRVAAAGLVVTGAVLLAVGG